MSQAHLFSKVMKSGSGHGPKCYFSDSKWHCPWRLALQGRGMLVKGGLHQMSRRSDRAPGLGDSGSLQQFLTGAAVWFWQRPGHHGDEEIGKENESS